MTLFLIITLAVAIIGAIFWYDSAQQKKVRRAQDEWENSLSGRNYRASQNIPTFGPATRVEAKPVARPSVSSQRSSKTIVGYPPVRDEGMDMLDVVTTAVVLDAVLNDDCDRPKNTYCDSSADYTTEYSDSSYSGGGESSCGGGSCGSSCGGCD